MLTNAHATHMPNTCTQVAMNEESVARLEGMMRDAKFSSEKVQKEYNQMNEKVQKLHHDLEEQIHTNTQLLAENSQKQVCCVWDGGGAGPLSVSFCVTICDIGALASATLSPSCLPYKLALLHAACNAQACLRIALKLKLPLFIFTHSRLS